MSYHQIERRLRAGGIVILDGGTGTELERRGAEMNEEAWCGPATLEHGRILEEIHRDYIAAGADVITANTFATSRLMLEPAGYGDRVEEINRAAVAAALRARDACGRSDVLVAGSLSHMCPVEKGTALTDLSRAPRSAEMSVAFDELAGILKEEGCDLIILEMMYHRDRMEPAFEAAAKTGLPVWAGFSVRRGESGEVLAFAHDADLPFAEVLDILGRYDLGAAGIMHSSANVTADAIAILHEVFDGPLMAYPDSGYFKMPHWQFEGVIPPDALLSFAREWVRDGVQIVGGCCGLSPEHIAALQPLKQERAGGRRPA